jgi:hypothetical protein
MSASVRIVGLELVSAALERLGQGGQVLRSYRVRVGSSLAYAFGQETGRHRGGQLARRDGGAHFLEQALDAVRSQVGSVLRAALPKGPPAVRRALLSLGYLVQGKAQPLTPVESGQLRASLHTEVSERG